MKNPENQEQRLDLLTEWKRRLGINDWTIAASLSCYPSEIDDHLCGQAEWHTSVKSGYVKILAEQFYENSEDYDFEETLVHELLHLKFGIFYDNLEGIAKDLLHQTIEELAKAFVDAKRSVDEAPKG